MNIKLDENLPHQLVQLLTDLGHDVDTVPAEHLTGRDDDVTWAAAQTAGRFLATQDLDFSDARKYGARHAPGASHSANMTPCGAVMRSMVSVAVVSVGVILGCGDLASHAQSQKPTKKSIVYTHYNIPATLSEMVSSADAIVRGRVVGASAKDLDRDGVPRARVMTSNRFKVLEIIHTVRGHFVDSNGIDILTDGGKRDRGEYIEEVIGGIPPLAPGRDYLLFLRWDDQASAWVVAYGPDGVLDLQSGVVDSPGSSGVTKLQKGKSAADYVAVLKRSGRNR